MREWTESKACESERHCRACRQLGPNGAKWRLSLKTKYGYSIPETDFDCPKGKDWLQGGCQNCGH